MTTPKTGIPYLTHGETNGEVTYNSGMDILDFFSQRIVINNVLVAEPTGVEGAAYIIPASATGTDWSGNDGKIGHFINGIWNIYTPYEGFTVWNLIDDSLYRYDGTNWVAVQTQAITSPSSASNILVLDLDAGNSFDVTLTENVTTLTISNVPSGIYCELNLVLTQDASGPWTFAWPASTKWAGGTTPTITASINAIDIFKLSTVDGGTTWYGMVQEQNLS